MSYIKELTSLCGKLGCSIIENCSLKEYTTFKIGGSCKALISINTVDTIVKLISFLKENNTDYFIIGKGSNIIVSDEGYDGVILLMGNDFDDITVSGNKIICSAGASLATVCCSARNAGLSGMENLFGIPGTVGGALYMNAGAYGTEMSDVTESAEYIDENGELKKISKEDMKLSYRHSIFSEIKSVITLVTFNLSKGNPDEIKTAMNECISKRKEKQPLEYPSAGSTFKRPKGSYASLLIDQCGLKGLSFGGAEVSCKHCGFVINKGSATCKDVLTLCEQVKQTVKEKTGYELELEPIILGNK